jgi:hypothetical protein
MKGDFSRDSFDPLRHFSRVLHQQGRVELDADGNERQAIQLHLLRSLAADLIGPHGGPGTGFQISDTFDGQALQQNFSIGRGHYYVDGWLCENDAGTEVLFSGEAERPSQPAPMPAGTLEIGKRYLAYLDVWERHLSAVEADAPADRLLPTALHEVALGGIDTTSRAQVVWRVGVSEGTGLAALPPDPVTPANWQAWMQVHWTTWRAQWQPLVRGRMKAKAAEPTQADASKPCVVSPQARYRGLENQLYRVEIHRGGRIGNQPVPTFVWSRENGSVVFALERVDDASVKLADVWRDARFALTVGDIVEITDEAAALSGWTGLLRRVTGVDLDTLTVTLEGTGLAGTVDSARRPVLRRWDHGRLKGEGGARPQLADDLGLVLTEGRWLALEDGVSVWFDPPADAEGPHPYRSGDHWLIAARTALGDVLWPRTTDAQRQPLALPPHGVDHHYAPLAIVTVGGNGAVTVTGEPRRQFKTLVELSG